MGLLRLAHFAEIKNPGNGGASKQLAERITGFAVNRYVGFGAAENRDMKAG